MLQDRKQSVRQNYMGERGDNYHTKKHSSVSYVQDIVALRARKIKPLIKADDSILEFGVGTGINLLHLQCRRRIGYDPSTAGRDTCTSAGIEFVSDIALVKGKQFSAVLCHHVLEHVPDPYNVLEQIWQLLLVGGRLLLFVPFESNRYRRFYLNDIDQHLFSWNVLTLGNLITSVGFTVDRAEVHPFGYEQKLAFLSKYGLPCYHLGLWMIRKLMPADEVLLVATKN